MQDFKIKPSFEKDKVGTFLFFLSYILVHCSRDGILFQRKYAYETYEDYYFSNIEQFSSCNEKLRSLVERKKENKDFFETLKTEEYQSVIDEFENRCISYRTGQRESWLEVLFCILSVLGVISCISEVASKFFTAAAFIFCFTAICISGFIRCIDVRRVIFRKTKDPKKIIRCFPASTNEFFKKLDELCNELKSEENKDDVLETESLTSDEMNILEELVQEKQLVKKDGTYRLVNPVNAFLNWKEKDPKGKVYSDEIDNKLMCKAILQKDGSKITSNTIYQAKSRNKDKEKDYIE